MASSHVSASAISRIGSGITNHLSPRQINHIIKYWKKVNSAYITKPKFTVEPHRDDLSEDKEENKKINTGYYYKNMNDAYLKRSIYIKYLEDEYEKYLHKIGLSLGVRDYNEQLFCFLNDGVII